MKYLNPCPACGRPDRLIRIREVEQMTGRSRSSIYRDIDAGTFPAPVRIGPNAVAWWESEVRAWMANLPRASAPRHGYQFDRTEMALSLIHI